MSKKNDNSHTTQIIVAIIAASAMLGSAFLTYQAAREPVVLVIEATQTAEAKPTSIAQTLTAQAYQQTLTAIIPTASPTKITATLTPKPSPTITTVTDPNIYDDFDNIEIEGTFDENLWRYWDDRATTGFYQANGVLRFSGTNSAALLARRHANLHLYAPTFYEADLILNGAQKGSVTIKLHGSLPGNGYWTTQCGIYGAINDKKALAFCEHGNDDGSSYTNGKEISFDTWHHFRIEINPSQQIVIYYIDGESVGNLIVPDYQLELAEFSLIIETYTSTGTTSALIENIRYGVIE